MPCDRRRQVSPSYGHTAKHRESSWGLTNHPPRRAQDVSGVNHLRSGDGRTLSAKLSDQRDRQRFPSRDRREEHGKGARSSRLSASHRGRERGRRPRVFLLCPSRVSQSVPLSKPPRSFRNSRKTSTVTELTSGSLCRGGGILLLDRLLDPEAPVDDAAKTYPHPGPRDQEP